MTSLPMRDHDFPNLKTGLISKGSGVLKILAATLVLLAVFLPIGRLINFLFSNGENSLSNDFADYMYIVDKVLDGSYHWLNYLRDTFKTGHSNALPFLFHIFVAKFFGWNRFVSLSLGIGFNLVKLLLCHSLLSKDLQKPLRWVLWPILSALIFSTSQVSTFEFDFATIELGLNQLGVVLSLWGIFSYPRLGKGIVIGVLGGIIASFSRGDGIAVWPILLIGLILVGDRKKGHYILWAIGFFAAFFPYLYFLFLNPTPGEDQKMVSLVSLVNWSFFLPAIGWPFSQNFSPEVALHRGIIGFALLIFSGIILKKGSRNNVESLGKFEFLPSYLLILYSLVNIYQISLFRKGLAPWYAGQFIFFWIGLSGISLRFFSRAIEPGEKTITKARWLFYAWGSMSLTTLGYFYFNSNITFDDKSFYMRAHAPVSASCLRNYRSAPTYCEQSLFLWEPGQLEYLKKLAEPLERHRLSVFSKRQRWTLQGDFILENVRLVQAPSVPSIFWTEGLSVVPGKSSDYHHLNLFLHSPNSIEWELTLPKNLQRANFYSAVAISPEAPREGIADGVNFEVKIQEKGQPYQVYYSKYMSPDQRNWEPFSLSLDQFAGKTVIVQLTTNALGNNAHDWAMYRYPFVDLILDDDFENNKISEEPNRPTNTDISPAFFAFRHSDLALRPSIQDKFTDIVPYLGKIGETEITGWIIRADSSLNLEVPKATRLQDFSFISFGISPPPGNFPRAVNISFKFDGDDDYSRSVWIPLLQEEGFHQYNYDLKLLELGGDKNIAAIKFAPSFKVGGGKDNHILISGIHLIWKGK